MDFLEQLRQLPHSFYCVIGSFKRYNFKRDIINVLPDALGTEVICSGGLIECDLPHSREKTLLLSNADPDVTDLLVMDYEINPNFVTKLLDIIVKPFFQKREFAFPAFDRFVVDLR